jgi:radical SAM protein with 4Fe4S-binding SPASM domain
MERLLDPAGDDLRGLPLGGVREVYLHVTNRCRGACAHCYNESSRHDGDELDTRSWRRVIDEAVELGAGSFVILGGDPFLRNDLIELIDHMTGTREARVRIFFNREIDAGTASTLATAGRGRLRPLISVDGSREVNDDLRGAGNFDGVLRSITALREAGLEPLVNAVALRPVIASLPEALPVLADAGVRRLHLILPHQRGGLDRHLDMVPSGSELLGAVRDLDAACSAAGMVLDNIVSWRRRANGRQDLCTAGCRDIAVDPCGMVHACAITCGDPAFAAGDLRRESLADVWRGSPSLRLLRAAHARDREECAACPVVDACGGECWVQAHYAARARGLAAGYGARFPYCELVRPVFEEIAVAAREAAGGGAPRTGREGRGALGGCGVSGACGGQAAAGAADFTLFDCI